MLPEWRNMSNVCTRQEQTEGSVCIWREGCRATVCRPTKQPQKQHLKQEYATLAGSSYLFPNSANVALAKQWSTVAKIANVLIGVGTKQIAKKFRPTKKKIKSS